MARSFRFNLSLPPDLHEAVAAVAEDERRSIADVCRDVLREHFFGPGAEPMISGVGDLAIRLIREGYPNELVLDAVREQFKDAGTTADSISWYRSKLRRDGEDIPTSLEAERQMQATVSVSELKPPRKKGKRK